MAWKISDGEEARRRFVAERLTRKRDESMSQLCRRHGISRQCGYKWWGRFRGEGWPGLVERAHVSAAAQAWWARWWPRVQEARSQCRYFGPKKLRWKLRQDYPRVRLPGVRTLARWLQRAGQAAPRKRRARPGPVHRLAGRLSGCRANDVWTIDLKGHFRTADRRQINPLTVRDLASRFVLAVRDVPVANERRIGVVVQALFRRYGLPRAMRMDNGGPFGGSGPRGWTQLTARWIKLGIKIEYGRPRCPQDNAAHEQMHLVLKNETTRPAASNARAQQQRFDRWRRRYNEQRPHESLAQRPPAALYQPSKRVLPARPPRWTYPPRWLRIRLDARGRYQWRGHRRLIGRAFGHEQLGAKRRGPDQLAIYFGPHLLGILHATDRTGLRPVQWRLNPQ